MKRIVLTVSLILFCVLLISGCTTAHLSTSSKLISPPVLINGSQPFYPLEASLNDLEGEVVLLLNISEEGKVSKMSLKGSSGSEVLDQAALRYAKNLTFQPATENDKKVACWITWNVRYITDNIPKGSKAFNVLVFSKSSGYRHQSIEKGMSALKVMALENDFGIEFTEDSTMINGDVLSNFQVLLFLNTTGDILGPAEEAAVKRFINFGGGFVGIHSAVDTEYDWPWYGKMVGAYFSDHPEKIQKAAIKVAVEDHISTVHLPAEWERVDEWYNLKNNLDEDITVLTYLDESSYKGGKNGDNHPFSWCHDYDGGRAWITIGGHLDECYSEINFLKHILGGIKYAAGRRDSYTIN